MAQPPPFPIPAVMAVVVHAEALSDAQAVHWLPLRELNYTQLDLIEGVARIVQKATAGP